MDIVTNRKAFRDFSILEKVEGGVVLLGTEVKSIRRGKVDLQGSFVRLERGEAFLYEANIQVYEQASHESHDPKRARKILLHKNELKKLALHTEQLGRALPALRLYWKRGNVKIEIGLGKGKNLSDKREDLKKKTISRETERELLRFQRKG